MDALLGRTREEPPLTERMQDGSQDGGLVVENVTRLFNAQRAVDDVSFSIAPGELVALVGASGSGKTTTLRIVAGYERPDAGRILFGGRDITGVPPSRRDFGMVFQHYALFPHMSVAENVAFGLEARGVKRSERLARAEEALASVGLGGKGGRMVQQLSGGEQQRVALARAVVIRPRLLLLDEPLSNLDPTLRQETRDELRATLQRAGAPALFVTHDQDDAFAIADRVVLLSRGRVLQIGSPEDLYAHPASRGVAAFIGHATLVSARRDGTSGIVVIAGREHRVPLGSTGDVTDPQGAGALVLRPEALALERTDAAAAADRSRTVRTAWAGRVRTRRFAGATFVYHVTLDEHTEVEVISPERLDVGTEVSVRVTRPVPMVA